MAIQILLPIRFANLLPARKDGAIILATSQEHMNHHLPAGRSVPAGKFQSTDNIPIFGLNG